jgi:hypothetical protein
MALVNASRLTGNAPLQSTWLLKGSTVAKGATVIENDTGFAAQVFDTAATVIKAVIGKDVAFKEVKAGNEPVPVSDAKPINDEVLVQLKVAVGTKPLKITDATPTLLQIEVLDIAFIVGVGSTLMVKVSCVPGQVLAVGTTVIKPVAGTPADTAKNGLILPIPEAAEPMDGTEFVHANVVPVTELTKPSGVIKLPLQTKMLDIGVSVATGFTVIENTMVAPEQVLESADTDKKDVIGTIEILDDVKAGMLPVPVKGARPMDAVAVHEITDPATDGLKMVPPTDAALQIVRSATGGSVGVGFTVIVNEVCEPRHVWYTAVTKTKSVAGEMELVPVKVVMSPDPPVTNVPIAGLLLTHVKVVPAKGLEKFTGFIIVLLHAVMSDNALTVATGFTVIEKTVEVPVQVLETAVTVMIAVSGTLPAFVEEKETMFPVPVSAPMPISAVVLVQSYDAAPMPAKGRIITAELLQTTWSTSVFTLGAGLTVIEKDWDAPLHALAVGVTVTNAVIAEGELLVPVNALMVPLPAAVSPIDVVLFDQLKTVFDTEPEKAMPVVSTPLHII